MVVVVDGHHGEENFVVIKRRMLFLHFGRRRMRVRFDFLEMVEENVFLMGEIVLSS